MASYSSATVREQTPHLTNISNALKRRTQSVIDDKSIDAQTRALVRYALETNDPWLPELVRRIDAGETVGDDLFRLHTRTIRRSIERRKDQDHVPFDLSGR